MNWQKILFEEDDQKLNFKEFLVQALLVGGGLIAAFAFAGLVL